MKKKRPETPLLAADPPEEVELVPQGMRGNHVPTGDASLIGMGYDRFVSHPVFAPGDDHEGRVSGFN